MAERTVQLVLQYDGAAFSGWQRQPSQRTVQGVVEEALERAADDPSNKGWEAAAAAIEMAAVAQHINRASAP